MPIDELQWRNLNDQAQIASINRRVVAVVYTVLAWDEAGREWLGSVGCPRMPRTRLTFCSAWPRDPDQPGRRAGRAPDGRSRWSACGTLVRPVSSSPGLARQRCRSV